MYPTLPYISLGGPHLPTSLRRRRLWMVPKLKEPFSCMDKIVLQLQKLMTFLKTFMAEKQPCGSLCTFLKNRRKELCHQVKGQKICQNFARQVFIAFRVTYKQVIKQQIKQYVVMTNSNDKKFKGYYLAANSPY